MTARSSPSVRLRLEGDESELEYQVRRALATRLNEIITMDPADLVENVVELTAAVMQLLRSWAANQGLTEQPCACGPHGPTVPGTRCPRHHRVPS